MTVLWIAAIALLLILLIFLVITPKQGKSASNAPQDESYQLSNPQETFPAQEIKQPPLPQQSRKSGSISNRVLEEVPAPSPEKLGSEQDQINRQIQVFMEKGKKIQAIKMVRSFTGWGLKESKDYLDNYPHLTPLKISPQTDVFDSGNDVQEQFDIDRHDINDRIRLLIQQHRKIEAIKVVRTVTNWDLREAKDYVEAHPRVNLLPVEIMGPVKSKVNQLLTERKQMDAIRLVQQRTGMMAGEAKDYIENHFGFDFDV